MTQHQCKQTRRLEKIENKVEKIDGRIQMVERWREGNIEKLDNIESALSKIEKKVGNMYIDKSTIVYTVLGIIGASFVSGLAGVLLSMWMNGGS